MKNIRTRFVIILCSISLVSALTSAAIIFSLYSSYIDTTINDRLNSGLNLVAKQLDLGDMEKHIQLGKELDQAYIDELTSLANIADSFGYSSIYTLQKQATGSFRFILDSENLGNTDDSGFLQVYGDAPPEVEQAFHEQRTIISEPYTDEWGTFVSAFAPISRSGQVIGVIALDCDVAMLNALYLSAYKGCAIAIGIAMLLTVLISLWVAKGISDPLKKTVAMIKELGCGHLGNRLRINRHDEIGQMSHALDDFADSLQNEVVASLHKLAEGDLTFDIKPTDDADEIRCSLKKLEVDLNNTMANIQMAGSQIASGSNQVSDSSQTLSQGATEQASSLEQISSSMQEISSQTKLNADNAVQANTLSTTAKTAAEKGNQQMRTMVEAMDDIKISGQNISKIIKVIDEIAFQTNLLALNAAVEAARAGQHGKGFAVVAEEVRNLAARSAKAAQETADLIENSVAKTDNGAAIATQTAEALDGIVTTITNVAQIVEEITKASNDQSEGISQVTIGLNQIDQVTQNNTATAEESAATAEELSSQAVQLQHLLTSFTLKKTRHLSLPQD